WCCVTYSSGAAIDALIAGVPPICMSPASLAYKLCSRGLSDIAAPLMPTREQFFYDLAYSQWSLDEINNGTVWRHIWPAARKHLNEVGNVVVQQEEESLLQEGPARYCSAS